MVLTSCKTPLVYRHFYLHLKIGVKNTGNHIALAGKPKFIIKQVDNLPIDRARKVVAAISASSCLIWARSRSFVTAATANCAFCGPNCSFATIDFGAPPNYCSALSRRRQLAGRYLRLNPRHGQLCGQVEPLLFSNLQQRGFTHLGSDIREFYICFG